MIKKFLVLCLCVILSGCSLKNDKTTIIKFSTWGSASEIAIIKPIITEFERNNPNVKIELIHIPQDYFQKLHLLFASNLAPDVIFINNLNLPIYSNYLEDLSKDINQNNFYPKALEALSYNNKIYAIPRDISTLMIYYNKTLFKKYNVPFPNENWTLDEMILTANKFKNTSVYGISYEPLLYYTMPYIYYYGGGILSKNGTNISNNTNSQLGINTYKNMAYKYHIAPVPSQIGNKTLAQMFLDGQIAMHLSGRWLVPKYRECAKFDWDIVNFPKYSVPCDASGWAVSKSSKHKDIAIKFVLFLSNKQNIDKMTRDGLIVPARIDIATSKTFNSNMPAHSYLFLKTAQKAIVPTISKDYNNLTDRINDEIFNTKN